MAEVLDTALGEVAKLTWRGEVPQPDGGAAALMNTSAFKVLILKHHSFSVSNPATW